MTGPVSLAKLLMKPAQELIDSALQCALKDPLKNALIISNLSQLKNDCSLAIRNAGDDKYAIASYYMDLPFNSIALLASNMHEIKELINELIGKHPKLANQPIYGFCDETTLKLMEQSFNVTKKTHEIKMVLQTDNIPVIDYDKSSYRLERLTIQDLIEISRLYAMVPAMAWTPRALEFGPYYGVFYKDHLVSIAGVHFVTKWTADIGNIVTHFKHRRQNLAYICTKATVDSLRGISENIFLCVFADNESAIKLYEKMGFVKSEDLYLIQYYV